MKSLLFLLASSVAFAGINDCSDQYYGEYQCSLFNQPRENNITLKINKGHTGPVRQNLNEDHSEWAAYDGLSDWNTQDDFFAVASAIKQSPFLKYYKIELLYPSFEESYDLLIPNDEAANEVCQKDRLILPLNNQTMEIVLFENLQNNQPLSLGIRFAVNENFELFCKKTKEIETQEFDPDLFFAESPIRELTDQETAQTVKILPTEQPNPKKRKAANIQLNSTKQDSERKTKKQRPLHTCEVCGKKLKNAEKFQFHVNKHKEENRAFKCHYCPRAFSTKYPLRDHENTHLQARTHFCQICQESFEFYYLKKHILAHKATHPENLGVWCPDCFEYFIDWNSIEKHRSEHSPNHPLKLEIVETSKPEKNT